MSKPKHYDVLAIINRAAELGITLSVAGDDLKVQADRGVVTPKALAVIKAHKQQIINYLRSLEEQYRREVEEDIATNPPLCSTCLDLDADRETAAIDEPGPDGLRYCAEHHPGLQQDPPLAPGEKRITFIDGIRMLEGYSDEEYRELLLQEAIEAHRQRLVEEQVHVAQVKEQARLRRYQRNRREVA